MTAPDVLVPLTLVRGDEELLVDRAVSAVVSAARDRDEQTDVRDLAGGTVVLADLLDLLSPSLFGDQRVVVVRAAQDLDRDVAGALSGYAAEPLESVCLVVCHTGMKNKALAEALQVAGARVVECPRLTRPGDRLDFVRAELRVGGRQASEGAVRALTEAVGSDLRELAGACSQLLADTTGMVDEQVVATYHRGKAETSGFEIADHAVEGDASGALELLRWALSVGVPPVLVSSALATGVRNIGRVASAGRGPSAALGRQLGLPPWKVERVQRQSRGWRPEGVTAALHAVAMADGDVKGLAADPAYALERAVLAVVAARTLA
ncbi:MAG: DNA polymerase III subunit delta [Actinomycetota bacterium]|nr:DNA polymerase III subunit delta [Actinomycetota bacterium]